MNVALDAAVQLIQLMALTAMSYMWARIAIAAHKGLAAGNDNSFYEAKLATARFFTARVLPWPSYSRISVPRVLSYCAMTSRPRV